MTARTQTRQMFALTALTCVNVRVTQSCGLMLKGVQSRRGKMLGIMAASRVCSLSSAANAGAVHCCA